MIEQCGGEVIKLKQYLYALIQLLDKPLSPHINSKDLVELVPPLHRVL